MSVYHIPVLAKETIESLNIRPDGIYIDATAGAGGHSELIAQRLTTGRLISLDKDPDAIAEATKRLSGYECSTIIQTDFSEIREAALTAGVTRVDGVLMDIGVSSHQLDDAQRGFSYQHDAPLDMRMSRQGVSAKNLVNELSSCELTRLIGVYGEERYAGSIAREIVKYRERQPIETTLQLAEIVKSAMPMKAKREKGHPAKRTFQALRIAVNDELGCLEKGMKAAFDLLKAGGRLSVITFHSLEDRMVKQQFAKWCEGCTCPPEFPVCVCGKKPRGRLVNKKPIIASDEELLENERSHSAKLRTIEKLEED